MKKRRYNIVATCDYCEMSWSRVTSIPPEHLQGVCMDCQADSDTEKPLTFRLGTKDDQIILALPVGWLASDIP